MSWHEGAHLLSPSATSISCTARAVAMVAALTALLTSSSSKAVTFEASGDTFPVTFHTILLEFWAGVVLIEVRTQPAQRHTPRLGKP